MAASTWIEVLSGATLATLLAFGLAPALAQSDGAGPGAPGATTTIDGRYLLPPPPQFRGTIDANAVQSTPYWPELMVPPEGAPNVLLVMTDDVGFAAPSTFGGVIPKPTLDGIAAEGLRYTRFHTTALCSATRAALLTGRNHHSVATATVVDQATGFPGYDSVIKRDTVAIGEILKQNGYDTSWFGKDHNTPQWVAHQAGPFTDWPTGRIKGFDYCYGFIGDDSSQWTPNNLFRNTTPIEPYLDAPEGWNLITAMADEAIGRIRMLSEVQPDRPFMIYYAPGGTHSPHHTTPEWVDRISAMHLFDGGWNALRDTIFANQKRMGIIPEDAEMSAWPEGLPAWDTLSDEAMRLCIRQAEVYAAYLAYTDHEVGRVVQAIEDLGRLDDTLIIYISGDNGASPEGTLNGLYSEFAVLNGITQRPIEGVSMAYTWDDAAAPGRRVTQYFEVFGSRAIYHDGWIASAPPIGAPWILSLEQPPTDVMNGFPWELYHIDEDWTQANDLAASEADQLRDMQQLFTMEATKYNVFPLDDSRLTRFISHKPSYSPGRTEFAYAGAIMNVPYPETGTAPSLLNRSY
jgi:arylsulfatase